MIAEADRQGTSIDPPDLDYRERASWTTANALRRLGASLVETASTAALTSTTPGATGSVVADAVGQAVDRLTDAQQPSRAAGAVTSRAVNAGRGHAISTARPTARSTRPRCSTRTRAAPASTGTAERSTRLEEALDQFPGGGGNKDCEGGDQCRCVVVAVLATEQEVAT